LDQENSISKTEDGGSVWNSIKFTKNCVLSAVYFYDEFTGFFVGKAERTEKYLKLQMVV
jgi:hypothetical protein